MIDSLLSTPMLAEPIKVKRLKVDGGVVGDGRLYVFDDPALDSRPAGQKILLRMGRENTGKLMAKLVDIRRRIVMGAMSRPTNPR